VTLPVLWAARRLLFLVSGDAKAPAVARVLQSKDEELPATQAVSGARLVTWIVDTQAANGLSLS
jgi:6-phosphogluconolactonase/glucosamine-6-phosphate isomerase/deaminase